MTTPTEAAAVVSTIVGSVGVGGVVVAFFGYLAAVRKGRQGEPERALAGGLALVADSESVGRLTASIEVLSVQIKSIAGSSERAINLAEKTQSSISERLDAMVEEHRKLRRYIEDNMRLRRADEPK